ncbi:MAG: FadR/GntR family transcriptional regulator [Lachnospiraceae bacterium]|nr:FadR/GntR family transcriptional regulator [Lachnospiraceae bacterium]
MPRREKLSTTIQNTLQERIMDGTYIKGDYLPSENALCNEFEVSRTTIRDAVGGLVEKGFVERQHGKGILVIDKSNSVATDSFRNMMLRSSYSVEEFLETREMIEKQIAVFAAKRATESQICAMENSISMMMKHEDDLNKYVEYDLDFHKQLAQASQNRLLIAVYEAIVPMLQQMIMDVVRATGAVEHNMRYHTQILECIKAHDAESAQEKTIEHDRASEKMFRESIDKKLSLEQVLMASGSV